MRGRNKHDRPKLNAGKQTLRQGVCIFCQAYGKLTFEHIWPQWAHDLINSRREFGRVHLTGLPLDTASSPLQRYAKRKVRTGGVEHSRYKVVCIPCNGRWMSQFQTNCKRLLTELILGNWPAGEPYGDLPAWVTMFAMVYEHADTKTIMLTQAERTAFYERRSAIQGWAILVGQIEPDTAQPAGQFHRALGIRVGDKADPRLLRSQITIGFFGKMLFVAFSIAENALTDQAIEHVSHDLGLLLIHPSTSSVFPAYQSTLPQVSYTQRFQDIALHVERRMVEALRLGMLKV